MDHSEKTSAAHWERKLIDDYYNYRWKDLLEPVCATAARWKAGELTIAAMAETLENIHGQVCELRNLFAQRDDRLVLLIQWMDREWFEGWIRDYSPPPGARVVAPQE